MSNHSQFRMPTPTEMEALKAAAHRARARCMKIVLQKTVRAIKWRVAHLAAGSAPSRVSHA